MGSILNNRYARPPSLAPLTHPTNACLNIRPFPPKTGEHYGYYRNLWSLTIPHLDTFTQVFFGASIVYGFTIGMTKMTIMFLYRRIFRLCAHITLCVWATQALNVAVMVIYTVGLFIACTPLEFYWAFAAPVTGECPDPIDSGGVTPGLNVALDCWMIALPLCYVWKMRVDWRDKVVVVGMFSLGLL